ncbi:unnamed protein product [Dracunculus medinensis]|uniref:Uncharacterized protein n=1 Tax=Dracunculus medinensis TaxID=318479 RepID=A0A0N4UJM0_DRAME|nr:unnamed protein product [Dracunculus medinensis]
MIRRFFNNQLNVKLINAAPAKIVIVRLKYRNIVVDVTAGDNGDDAAAAAVAAAAAADDDDDEDEDEDILFLLLFLALIYYPINFLISQT